MTDNLHTWLTERETIHGKATPGPWWWEGESGEDWPQSENSLRAGEEPVVVGWGYDASGIDVEDDDALYITDALNTLPKLLAGVRAVLELHTRSVRWCGQCEDEWPCATVQAIQEAINDE